MLEIATIGIERFVLRSGTCYRFLFGIYMRERLGGLNEAAVKFDNFVLRWYRGWVTVKKSFVSQNIMNTFKECIAASQ